MLLACAFIIIGLTLLVYGADRFVSGAASIASLLGMPGFIIGLTVVGLATSAPEILVGAVAAFNGKTELAIGNALGSNITNIALVLGATTVVSPLFIQSKTLLREYSLMMVALMIGLAVLFDGTLGRIDGIILLISIIVMMFCIVKFAHRDDEDDPMAADLPDDIQQADSILKPSIILIIGLVLLLGGAELLVRGATTVAKYFGMSDLLIGLTIVAIGTSLPELAASLMSAMKKQADMAVGNIVGSNMFNILAVMGIPAIINPSSFDPSVLLRDYPVMIALSLIMGWMVFLHGKGHFSRIEGSVLLLCFFSYQGLLFFTNT